MTRRVARPETRMEKEGEEEEEGRIWRNKVRIIEAIERSRGRWAAKWIPPSNGGWKKKRAHAHTHIHTHIYTWRVYVVFGETATPRVCSKSDNVALERRFVNTLEKMRGGGWFFLSLFFWGYERVFIFSGSLLSKNLEFSLPPLRDCRALGRDQGALSGFWLLLSWCGNDTPCNGEIEISREIGGKWMEWFLL